MLEQQSATPFSVSICESIIKDDYIKCREIEMKANNNGGDLEILQLSEQPYKCAGKYKTDMEELCHI
eukprot:1605935-Ditylum_brightwellii.AAC.1